MCRGNGEGGRRCPGCQGPTARQKHNERRRNNRALRRAVADWARAHGEAAEVVDQLARRPPAEAKAWAAARGLGPTALGLPAELAVAASTPTLTSEERRALKQLLASPDLFGLNLMLERSRAAALRGRAQRMLSGNAVLTLEEF